MHLNLACHPDTPATAIRAVTCAVARLPAGALLLRYRAEGDLRLLRVPAPVRSASRQDGLWRTTCFEAFARRAGALGYHECNFAPSTAWAAYGFDGYRERSADPELPPPVFDVSLGAEALEVVVVVDTGGLPGLPPDQPWQLNLTAVIEESDGTKSYWALAHPRGAPDFHDPACFVLELPAPEAP